MAEHIVLDWSKHKTGPPKPCVLCGRDAWMRDAAEQPCHKVCAEQAAATTGGRS